MGVVPHTSQSERIQPCSVWLITTLWRSLTTSARRTKPTALSGKKTTCKVTCRLELRGLPPLIILGVIIELFQMNITGNGAIVIAAIHMVCVMALLLASNDEAKVTRLEIVFTVVLLIAGLVSVTGMARYTANIASLAIIIAGIIGMTVTTLMTLSSIPAAWGLCRMRSYADDAQALLSTDTTTALPSWQLVESTYDYVRQYNAICRQDPATGARMDDTITQYAQAAAEGSGYARMGASPGLTKAVEERIDALHQAAQQ